jgi:hypothetical protein
VSTIHPALAAVTERITERSSAPAPPACSRLAKRKAVHPRGRLACANLAAQFPRLPGSTPTLLDAMTDTGLPHLARCGNRLGEPNCRAL